MIDQNMTWVNQRANEPDYVRSRNLFCVYLLVYQYIHNFSKFVSPSKYVVSRCNEEQIWTWVVDTAK